ncbi:MAG: peptide deformylase [Bacteroidota bacterium]|nr:peptide deformylase [Bacteroidota bacterium]
MILPIVAYGDPVLKQPAENINENYPELEELLKDMFETMYNAKGVGLAAPQIGKSIRLFIVDGTPFAEDDEPGMENWKCVFINPEIIQEEGKEWSFNEGCLSIPTIREDIYRKPNITITYYDENFEFHEEEFDGLKARIIQHEYDHIEGILFTDKINGLKKRLIKNKLANISKGFVDVHYKMNFPLKKGR